MFISAFSLGTATASGDLLTLFGLKGLKSIDQITIIDALCEGQIEGSASASKAGITDKNSVEYLNAFLKDIFLNKTAILQPDADVANPIDSHFNYLRDKFLFSFQDGTSNNIVLRGAEAQSSPIPIDPLNNELSFPLGGSIQPRTFSVTDSRIDLVKIKVKLDSLFRTNPKKGNRESSFVQIIIKANPANSSEIEVVNNKISGRSFNAYGRQYEIDLNDKNKFPTNTGASFFPVVFTVFRNNDSGDEFTSNRTVLDSVITSILEPNSYPHIAYTSLRFSAELFSRAPARFFRIRGKLIKIPAEGSAITAQYTISGNIYTIQKNNHGLVINDSIIFETTSGTGRNNTYIINNADLNSFTFVDVGYENGNVSSNTACTYKPNPYVDRSNGRIIYPNKYTFNGTFKSQKVWTSDPAWCLFDLLIKQTDRTDKEQYGCSIPEGELDVFSFFKASKYCNQLVNDGNGGLEPRFSVNCNINTRKQALTVIKDLCSVMRAIPFYAEGTIKIAQDAPKDFENYDKDNVTYDYVFNNSNVVDGSFIYQGTSNKTRFNVVNVAYFNLDTQEKDFVTVEDNDSIERYGPKIKTIDTFATTSIGQAQRAGQWFLFTQNNQTESVTFTTNIAAGSVLSIGSIIGIADRVKSSSLGFTSNNIPRRRGGLIKSATLESITIDSIAQTNLPNVGSLNPVISCLLPNGTVETRTIEGYSNNNKTIEITPDFSQIPVTNSPFILENDTFDAQSFRIVDIKENSNKTFNINAVTYIQSKYAAVEEGIALPTLQTNVLTSVPQSPNINDSEINGELAIQEKIEIEKGRPMAKLYIDWEDIDGAIGYQLIYTKDNENPQIINTAQSEHVILGSESGIYDIEIYSFNINNERSFPPTKRSVSCVGLSAKPENPTGLSIQPLNNTEARLSWDATTSLDVEHGGKCVVRHSTESFSSATFANSVDIFEDIVGSTSEVIVPAMGGTYSLKFVDILGQSSEIEAKVELPLPEVQNEIKIIEQRENPNFNGNKPNGDLSVVSSALQLANPANSLTGTYEFASVFDLESVFQNVRIQRIINSQGFNVNDDFDSIENLDLRDNFDGASSDRLKAKLQIQVSQDNSSFTSAQNIFNNFFKGRSFKFKSELISVDVNENIKFTVLGFDAFLPFRSENRYIDSSNNKVSIAQSSTTNANGLDVTFANKFFTGTSDTLGGADAFPPSIIITPYNMGIGVRFVIKQNNQNKFLNAAGADVTGEGFNIIFKDSSDNPVDVKFTFQALGYGKGD